MMPSSLPDNAAEDNSGQNNGEGLTTEGIGNVLERYFDDIAAYCPYEMPHKAVYHQAMFGPLTDATMGIFFENGYRRNGNCMYAMRCPHCSECVPIRINPQDFTPNRSQKRVWQKNQDISVGLAPVTMSDENLELLDRFLSKRFPASRSNAESYYSDFFITSMTKCFEIRYRAEDQLLGVAIVDCSDQWLNAVYFYFDPEQSWRSPGTFNILYLMDFCRRHSIENLYLGYWIEGLQGMHYKTDFRPHEILRNGRWLRVER
jgi:leucyl-tRNA---protein transferase